MRERFVREAKGKKKKNGDSPKPQVSWELFKHMEFLKDFVRHRK